MAERAAGFATKAGATIPWGSWTQVCEGISVQALKTTFNVRHDPTGEVVRPSGPAGRDNLMMALYLGKVPSYAVHCFGADALAGVPDERVL